MSHGLSIYNSDGALSMSTEGYGGALHTIVVLNSAAQPNPSIFSFPELAGAEIFIWPQGPWNAFWDQFFSVSYPDGVPTVTFYYAGGPSTYDMSLARLAIFVFIKSSPPSYATGFGLNAQNNDGWVGITERQHPLIFLGTETAVYQGGVYKPNIITSPTHNAVCSLNCDQYGNLYGFGANTFTHVLHLPFSSYPYAPLIGVEVPDAPLYAGYNGIQANFTAEATSDHWIVSIVSNIAANLTVYLFGSAGYTTPSGTGHGLGVYNESGALVFSTANQRPVSFCHPCVATGLKGIRASTLGQVPTGYPALYNTSQTYVPQVGLPAGVVCLTPANEIFLLRYASCPPDNKKSGYKKCQNHFYAWQRSGGNLLYAGGNIQSCTGDICAFSSSWSGSVVGRYLSTSDVDINYPLMLIDKAHLQ